MSSIPKILLDLIERPYVWSFSVVLPDGEIQATPAWLIYDGQFVRVRPFTELQMEQRLTINSKVSAFVIDPTNPSHFVDVQGHITEVDEASTEKRFEEFDVKYKRERNYLRQSTQNQKVYVVFPDIVNGQ